MLKFRIKNYIALVLVSLCICSAFAGPVELEAHVLEPQTPVRASIILLHGLGGNKNNFIDMVNQYNLMQEVLKMQDQLGARIILPQAPGNSWFNVPSMNPNDYINGNIPEDAAGIKVSQEAINKLIDREIARGVPSERIILGGISQGGAMALYSGLHYNKKLGGILAMSTWLPLRDELTDIAANKQTPILMLHGTNDNVLPLEVAKLCYDQLKQGGFNIKISTYPMGHDTCIEEMAAIGDWLVMIAK